MDAAVVIAILQDKQAKSIHSYHLLPKPMSFSVNSASDDIYIFAYSDLNNDLAYQDNEPFGWYKDRSTAFNSAKSSDNKIRIRINSVENNKQLVPEGILKNRSADLTQLANIKLNIGTVSRLDDTLFSAEQAEKGLWKPLSFMKDGGTGIHFLQTYDPHKTPVIFVHGINGSPRNFKTLINQLDTDKFQAWVVSYPSGFRLETIANGFYNLMISLHAKYGFEKSHIVAHSMGGLVSRGSINLCVKLKSCDFITSFTTLSTPWAGHKAAEYGLKYSPGVIPVWIDMAPESQFIQSLFTESLPEKLPHYLLFGVKGSGLVGFENNDGTVSIKSQIAYPAQEQAIEITGYNEGHISILSSQRAINKVNSIIQMNH